MGTGRSKVLIAKRDEVMYKRWLYWTEKRRVRLDDAIKILANDEFFISESRVIQILRRIILNGGKDIDLVKTSFSGFRLTPKEL